MVEGAVPVPPFLWYLCAVSAVAVFVTVYDKCAAKHRRRRTPEKTLFLLALLGGSAAMYLTMLLIRHKTLHKRFMLGLPAILLAQLAVYVVITTA